MNYDINRSGAYIRQLRIQRGYTQEMLATELNIDRSLISHIEVGKRGCSVEVLVRLSNFFGVSLDLLIFGAESTPTEITRRGQLKAEIRKLMDHLDTFQRSL